MIFSFTEWNDYFIVEGIASIILIQFMRSFIHNLHKWLCFVRSWLLLLFVGWWRCGVDVVWLCCMESRPAIKQKAPLASWIAIAMQTTLPSKRILMSVFMRCRFELFSRRFGLLSLASIPPSTMLSQSTPSASFWEWWLWKSSSPQTN